MRQREMLMRSKRSFPSLNSVDAGFVPSIKRPSYVAITRDLVRAPSTVSGASEHFVSSTVVKVPRIGDLKAGSVRLTAVVRSGIRALSRYYWGASCRFPTDGTHDYYVLISWSENAYGMLG